jgi:hypothetical protein
MSIDMEIPSLPETRAATPIPEQPEPASGRVSPQLKPTHIDLAPPQAPENAARQAGLGNLMKTAKQDVTVAEFDMGAFSW